MFLVPVGCWACPSFPEIMLEGLTSSLYRGSKVNQRATAQRCPLVTAFTPWGFSPPEEKLIILPHLGLMEACRETAQPGWQEQHCCTHCLWLGSSCSKPWELTGHHSASPQDLVSCSGGHGQLWAWLEKCME